MKPATMLSAAIMGPIVIIMDALDDSGIQPRDEFSFGSRLTP